MARAYAISKLGWIRDQQKNLANRARETPRQFINRESHFLWGRRHLMTVVHRDAKPFVALDHRRIVLAVRPNSDAAKRAEVIHTWHKALLHEAVPLLIQKWERKLKVEVRGYFLQRMKTKWGSCNHWAGHIRLNTELVKKPKDLLEYVIVHEMAHLIEPTHKRLPAIALDQDGFVAEVNAAAEAIFDNDVKIKDRRLFVRDPAARALLKEVIDQLRTSPRLNPSATDPIIVQRQDKLPVIVPNLAF